MSQGRPEKLQFFYKQEAGRGHGGRGGGGVGRKIKSENIKKIETHESIKN